MLFLHLALVIVFPTQGTLGYPDPLTSETNTLFVAMCLSPSFFTQLYSWNQFFTLDRAAWLCSVQKTQQQVFAAKVETQSSPDAEIGQQATKLTKSCLKVATLLLNSFLGFRFLF